MATARLDIFTKEIVLFFKKKKTDKVNDANSNQNINIVCRKWNNSVNKGIYTLCTMYAYKTD